MTDLEMTKLCAAAMGMNVDHVAEMFGRIGGDRYDPLHYDAQAMALVKKFRLQLWTETVYWLVADPDCEGRWRAINIDPNRAIVECVAKMQAGTGST